MTIWFTSDNHWGHKNIRKFCPLTRPHENVDEMDRAMIARWNEQVKPTDVVWMLGDVFFCDAQKGRNIMAQLPGEKHLIYGNHDKVIRGDSSLQGMFASTQEYKEIVVEKTHLVLFHYPIAEHNKTHHGSYHLHGHIHNRLSGVPGRILNVCIDSPELSTGDYSLYDLDTVAAMCERLPIRHHHEKRVDL